MSDFPYVYAWGNNEIRAKRKGQRCKILANGKMHTILLEFEDGFQMTTSLNSIRKADKESDGRR